MSALQSAMVVLLSCFVGLILITLLSERRVFFLSRSVNWRSPIRIFAQWRSLLVGSRTRRAGILLGSSIGCVAVITQVYAALGNTAAARLRTEASELLMSNPDVGRDNARFAELIMSLQSQGKHQELITDIVQLTSANYVARVLRAFEAESIVHQGRPVSWEGALRSGMPHFQMQARKLLHLRDEYYAAADDSVVRNTVRLSLWRGEVEVTSQGDGVSWQIIQRIQDPASATIIKVPIYSAVPCVFDSLRFTAHVCNMDSLSGKAAIIEESVYARDVGGKKGFRKIDRRVQSQLISDFFVVHVIMNTEVLEEVSRKTKGCVDLVVKYSLGGWHMDERCAVSVLGFDPRCYSTAIDKVGLFAMHDTPFEYFGGLQFDRASGSYSAIDAAMLTAVDGRCELEGCVARRPKAPALFAHGYELSRPENLSLLVFDVPESGTRDIVAVIRN